MVRGMSRMIAHTHLNANPWHLAMADGSTQRVSRWDELDWEHAAADAEAQQVEELHDAIVYGEMRLLRPLGKGTFGVAYECDFSRLNSQHPITVKLPRRLLDKKLLQVIHDGYNDGDKLEPMSLQAIYSSDDPEHKAQQTEYEHAVKSFEVRMVHLLYGLVVLTDV